MLTESRQTELAQDADRIRKAAATSAGRISEYTPMNQAEADFLTEQLSAYGQCTRSRDDVSGRPKITFLISEEWWVGPTPQPQPEDSASVELTAALRANGRLRHALVRTHAALLSLAVLGKTLTESNEAITAALAAFKEAAESDPELTKALGCDGN